MSAQARAVELDRADPLAALRAEFEPITDPGVIAYLDGNSLGRPPRSTRTALHELIEQQWAGGLIRQWEREWLSLPTSIGDQLGEVVLGARAGQTIVADSTTVLLYKAIRAAAAANPGRSELVTDVHNFPTDRYIVEGVAAELGLTVRWVETPSDTGVSVEQLRSVLNEKTAVLTLSHVSYHSAYLAPLREITAAVHQVGALVVWDLCHSAGSVPLQLDADEVDMAVGCTYKYLNAGPGAPAFLYVRETLLADFQQPIQGWMGRAQPFEMAQGYVGADGIRRALSGTPSVMSLIGVREGLRLVERAGIEAIRAKSTLLTEFAIELYDEKLAELGFALATPRHQQRRGGHVTITRDDARQLTKQLIDNGVLVDFRPPDGIRLGFSPLTTSFSELGDAIDHIAQWGARA